MAAKMNSTESESAQYGRKKKVDPNPNPLFLQWLTEWRDEAAAKERTRLHFTYQKAINSLKKYPLPLHSGKEAKILDFIGDKICKMLDDKLAKHIQEHGPIPDALDIHLPSTSSTATGVIQGSLSVPPPPCDDGNGQGPSGQPKPKKKRKPAGGKKEYVPAFRSGPYALLVILYRNMQKASSRGFMGRAELQREAQPLCDKSFTLPDPGSHYTAWSSMGGLVKKGLVIKDSNPAKYYITDTGSELAHKLELIGEQGVSGSSPQGDSEDLAFTLSGTGNPAFTLGLNDGRKEGCEFTDVSSVPDMDDVYPGMRGDTGQVTMEDVVTGPESFDSQGSVRSKDSSRSRQPLFTLFPGQFEVVLCVDTAETTGGAAGSRKVNLVPELLKNGVRCDVRKLQVGDFLWVAQEKIRAVPGQLHPPLPRELVLDYVVERKRMDDLAHSVKDGRFKEQKFRLKMCGLRRPIYLVEDFGSAQHFCIPEATLQQAIVNTQVVDGFFVKRTADMKESVTYLTLMTHYLQSLYAGKSLEAYSREDLQDQSSDLNLHTSVVKLLPFSECNETSVKNKVISVKEMFAKQLMQFHGMSKEKVAAVVNTYPTPVALLQSYNSCGSVAERERMLAPLKCGHTKRNLGPALSKAVYQLYCSTTALQ